MFFLFTYIGKGKKVFQIASEIVWNVDSNIFHVLPFSFRHQTKTFQIRNKDKVKTVSNVSMFEDMKAY